jgi:uncharacterized protein (DUF2062 family)
VPSVLRIVFHDSAGISEANNRTKLIGSHPFALRQYSKRKELYAEDVLALSVALVCAVVASLALGVLIAYAICLSMFHLFRIHSRQVALKQKAASPLATGIRIVGN